MQFLTPRRSGALAKTAARTWTMSLLVGAFATCSLTAVAQVCPFNDGNSTLANEGLVMTRYALGIRGSAMVASTAFAATDAPAVEANIACPNCGLNIIDAKDGSNNPTFTPADATIISRKIAGYKGAELTNGLNLGNRLAQHACGGAELSAGGLWRGGAADVFDRAGTHVRQQQRAAMRQHSANDYRR